MPSFEIWYARETVSLLDPLPTIETLQETHVKVGDLIAPGLEDVFEICNTDEDWFAMIGLIDRPPHSSMSVGDVAYDGHTYHICAPVGWQTMPVCEVCRTTTPTIQATVKSTQSTRERTAPLCLECYKRLQLEALKVGALVTFSSVDLPQWS